MYSSGSSTCINDRADLDDCELYTYEPNQLNQQPLKHPEVTHWCAEVEKDIRSRSRPCYLGSLCDSDGGSAHLVKNIDGNMDRRYALLSSAGWIPTMGVL